MFTWKAAVPVVVSVVMISLAQAAPVPVTVVESPFSADVADFLDRGFYVENYGADNLSQVILQYTTFTTGTYDTSLTVRIGTYDGTIVGETKTISTSLEPDVYTQVIYDFGGVSVPYGSLLTFTQQVVAGGNFVYYDTGVSAHPQITQTEGTQPPLDTFRREQVGVIITAVPEPAAMTLLALGALCLRLKRTR